MDLIRLRAQRVVTIAAGWAIAMFVFSIYEFSLLGTEGSYPNGAPYDYRQTLWLTPLMAFIGGFFIGTFEVFYLEEKLKRKPFGRSLVYRALIHFILLFALVAFGVHMYNLNILGKGFTSSEAISSTLEFISSIYMFIIIFIWSVALLTVLFVMKISDKYGPGVLKNILLGRYYNSRVEKRIFMFLDLKSSTTIAEKLGHIKYFRLLNDFFSDITNSVLKFEGEIYQYVGDEIVVSWKLPSGSDQAKCIACFFDISRTIADLATNYEAEYGLVPEFKAGFHCGEVTTGEVGVLKKEIIFTGDVLNTTSRIQNKCNEYNTRLIVSADLKDLLPSSDEIKYDDLGSISLRGRESAIQLYTASSS